MSAWARWESRARSPLAPTLPCSGTTGRIPAFSMATNASGSAGRTPLVGRSRTLARRSIIARTTSAGREAPPPPPPGARARRPAAGGVAPDQIDLEEIESVVGDPDVGELAETGV